MPNTREKLIELLESVVSPKELLCDGEVLVSTARVADHLIANGVMVPPESGIGDMSDGYHTFNELYHHRAVLFSVICNLHPLCSWKAKKHHDGTMYDGMFIVGINTPEGQATYHYDIDPYWDMFRVPEAEYAPIWDGHTPDEAIRRIGLLGVDPFSEQKWIPVSERLPEDLPENKGKKVINCIVAHEPYSNGKLVSQFRQRKLDNWDNKWYWSKIGGCTVTHWMPLPQAPKGE